MPYTLQVFIGHEMSITQDRWNNILKRPLVRRTTALRDIMRIFWKMEELATKCLSLKDKTSKYKPLERKKLKHVFRKLTVFILL